MADEPNATEDTGAESEPVRANETPVEKVEAILERVEPEERSEIIEAVMFHKGPMPPASMLADYENVVPGLAREIADGAKDEREFRQKQTSLLGEREFILNLVGLAAMLLALSMMLGIVAYMVATGNAVAGATLGAATIVGVTVALSNYRKAEPTKMPATREIAHTEKTSD